MIVVLRALGLGDLATAVPAIRGLRAAYPHRRLVLAAPEWLAPLVDLVGGIDELVPTDGLAPTGWSVGPCQLAVNLHGRGPESHRLLRAGEPRQMWAFRCPAAGHGDGPVWREEEHEVHRWCRLLSWYGVPADPADLGLRRPEPDRVPVGVSVLHPGGKGLLRRWPPQRFVGLAAALAGSGHRVVLTGGPSEQELVRQVAVAAGLPMTAVLAGRLSLAELAALVAHARLVVSADTGVAHLATAYRTPSVVIFGPVRPERWGPPPERPWHRVLWDPFLPAITVDQVRAAADEAQQAKRVGRAATA